MLFGVETILARPDESGAAAFEESDIAALCEAQPRARSAALADQQPSLPGRAGEEGGLLVSIQGRLYDVRAGERFYGDGRDYHAFTGRDASALLCTGCVTSRCLLRALCSAAAALARGGARAASAARKCSLEAGRWLEFFESHDKYPFVGVLPAQRALTGALSPGGAEEVAGVTALGLVRDALLGGAELSAAAAVERALPFLRLGLYALLGPRMPSRSRELLAELVLRVASSACDSVDGGSLDPHAERATRGDEAGPGPALSADADAEAREDLADALRDAEGVGDNDAVGVRIVARLLGLADADALAAPASSCSARLSQLAARFRQTSGEFERGDRSDLSRVFRPR